MKHFTIYKLLSLALVIGAVSTAFPIRAQVAVGVGTSEWNPGGMTINQGTINYYITGTTGFLEYVGAQHLQEWDNSGTFNLCGGTDYFKMKVPAKRAGNLTVKYVTSREVTQTLQLDDIKLTGWGGKDNWGNTATYSEAWAAYAVWLQGHTVTKVTLKVAAGNTANIRLEAIYSDDTYNQHVDVAAGAESETLLELTIPADRRDSFRQFYIRGISTGSATFNEISYNEIIDAPQPLIKVNTADDFANAQVVSVTTGQDGNFSTVTYNYTTTAETYMYVSRGQIRSLSITSQVSTTLPQAVTTIEDNTTWESQGTGLWTQLRPDNGNAKIWLTDYAAAGVDYASAEKKQENSALVQDDTEAGLDANNDLNNAQVIINGSKPYIDRAVVDVNTSLLGANNGVGFRLKANSKFRIQIFCDRVHLDANKLLKTGGADMETSTYLTNGYVTNINTDTGGATNTRMVTFDVTTGSSDQAYWVIPGAGNLNVGAIQVLLDNQVSNNASNVLNSQINKSTTIQFANNGNPQVKTDVDGTYTISYLASGTQLKCTDGSNNAYAYVYGPAMAFNAVKCYGLNTVMLNKGNAICLAQVPQYGEVTVKFIGDTGKGLRLTTGNTPGGSQVASGTAQYGAGTVTWTNPNNTPVYVWVESNSADNNEDYIYLSEISVKIRKQPWTTPIDGDFIWRSRPNEDIPENSAFESNYLFNYNDAETAQATEMVVNGTSVPTRDLTGDDDYIAFRIADNIQGQIRIYYTGTEPTLTRGYDFANATTSVTGTAKKSNENGESRNAIEDYMVYNFNSGDPKFYKLKGNIAGIQVLVEDPTSGELNAITGDMSLWVTDNLGTTINKGAAKLVLNRQSYLDENGYSKFNGNTDATLNSHQVYNHNSIQISGSETVSYKFGPGQYKVTFHAASDLSACGIYIITTGVTNAKTDGGATFADESGTRQGFGSIGYPRYITFDVADGSEGVINFSSWGGTTYFAGIEVESTQPKIEFVTAGQPGIFTGRYKGKLLIYCTDNGTLENFRVPVANYKNASDRTNITTNSPSFQLVKQHYDANTGTMPWTPQIVADGSYYKVTGFEDTDIDQLYKVTYTYNGVSDYYFLWFSNYLKTGWWTSRDAKLIVGTDNSANDPDHIIVGEFYVSSGSMGTLYFEAPDDTGFTGVDYVYTADNNTTAMRNMAKATSDNDKANEDAINLTFPADITPWGGAEITKFVEFAAHRNTSSTADQSGYGDWPDFTIKLTFHFVVAPTMELTTGSGSNSVKFNTYGGSNTLTPSNGQTVYYTTDGTRPNGTSPTSQGGQSVTNSFSATYYAAECITTARQFYKVNPYTTYIEGKTPYDLMTDGNNKSNDFYAISTVCYSPVTDLKVDYIDLNTGYLTHATNLTGGTAFDGTTLTGAGGTQYNYPVGSTAGNRQMTVKFGNTDLKVLQGSVFKEGGVSWALQGQLQFPFSEHLDCMQYDNNLTNQLQGYNDGSFNGDPRAECNDGPGGSWTENGGMFLTPITGDFLRFEPNYDGVITLWIRQNGAGQGNEIAEGNLTRRPVYIMDENGKIMQRSTIKPTSEHFFGIDGVYAEIDEVKSSLRMDFHSAWIKGLSRWTTTNDYFRDYNKATYRWLNVYYGLPLYQRYNREGHTGTDMRYTYDLADSWVSRTAKVESVMCDYSPIYYRSTNAQTHCEVNVKFDHTVNNGTVDMNSGTTVNDGAGFANYGWEVPTYNIVRYRFPVRAGKTYFVAGRGTKNGFVAVKLDPMPHNYNPADYVHAHNRTIADNSFETGSATAGSQASAGYNPESNMNSYVNTEPTFNIAMYCLWNEGVDREYYGAIHSGNVGKTKKVQLTQRTFKANYWYGLVLPFSVSETKLKEVFGDDVKVLYVDPYENSKNGHRERNRPWYSAINPGVDYIDNNQNNGLTLKLTHHYYQMLYANTPCFICPSKDVTNPDFGNVFIEAANLATSGDFTDLGYKIGEAGNYEYYITGSYYQGNHAGKDMYYMANYTGGVTADNTAVIYHAQNGVRLDGTRAWIEARPKPGATGAPGKAPLISLVGFNTFDENEADKVESGICDIIADESPIDLQSADSNVYDMMGRVVAVGTTDGLPSGVYIFRGQKVYIR